MESDELDFYSFLDGNEDNQPPTPGADDNSNSDEDGKKKRKGFFSIFGKKK